MRVALESAGTRLAASPLAGIATAGRRRCSATVERSVWGWGSAPRHEDRSGCTRLPATRPGEGRLVDTHRRWRSEWREQRENPQ